MLWSSPLQAGNGTSMTVILWLQGTATCRQNLCTTCHPLSMICPTVLTAHARDELGIDPDDLANPVQVTGDGHNVLSIAATSACNRLYQHGLVTALLRVMVPPTCVLGSASSQRQPLPHTGVGRVGDQLLHRRRHPAAERRLHQGPHDQVGASWELLMPPYNSGTPVHASC